MVSLVVNCGKTHIRHIDGESQTSSSRERLHVDKCIMLILFIYFIHPHNVLTINKKTFGLTAVQCS